MTLELQEFKLIGGKRRFFFIFFFFFFLIFFFLPEYFSGEKKKKKDLEARVGAKRICGEQMQPSLG